MAEQGVHIHTAHWPALSSFGGFEAIANIQIEAMMRNHALTAQCFVVCASSPTSVQSIEYMEKALGPQSVVKPGGGWSAIVHPFTSLVTEPATDGEERLVIADIDLDDIKDTKMWVDTTGHYARPDIFQLQVDLKPKKTTTFQT